MALTEIFNSLRDCERLLNSASNDELIVVRLESLLFTIQNIDTAFRHTDFIDKLLLAIDLMCDLVEEPSSNEQKPVGRPAIVIPVSGMEYLLSLKFSATDIAKFYGVSRHTIFRRLADYGLSVSSSYSTITDVDLNFKIGQILQNFPNTGYKRMKGFLLAEGLKITDHRVRQAMREVDPQGVYQRTLCNRAIVRRQYFVTYFNQMWHLDTNMKLIRWNIVIRSCIDGKSRLVVYLDASGDNTAETNCVSFLKGVAKYGVPQRTRSDKGGENVKIAEFMIEQRGLDRGSHICGRSVHNQRIERYWRDVFYGYTGTMYNMFMALEADGYLNVDDPRHIALIHYVFLPRLNHYLEIFRNSWNCHPLSSEKNYTPNQLMLIHMPPDSTDKLLTQDELEDVNFICNRFEDIQLLVHGDDTIISPNVHVGFLSNSVLNSLAGIDILGESNESGYDIFLEALHFLT